MEISPAAPPFIVGLQQVNGLHHIMIWGFHHSAAPLPADGEGESVILHPAKKRFFFLSMHKNRFRHELVSKEETTKHLSMPLLLPMLLENKLFYG